MRGVVTALGSQPRSGTKRTRKRTEPVASGAIRAEQAWRLRPTRRTCCQRFWPCARRSKAQRPEGLPAAEVTDARTGTVAPADGTLRGTGRRRTLVRWLTCATKVNVCRYAKLAQIV